MYIYKDLMWREILKNKLTKPHFAKKKDRADYRCDTAAASLHLHVICHAAMPASLRSWCLPACLCQAVRTDSLWSWFGGRPHSAAPASASGHEGCEPHAHGLGCGKSRDAAGPLCLPWTGDRWRAKRASKRAPVHLLFPALFRSCLVQKNFAKQVL